MTDRLAVIFPGAMFGPHTPLLMFSADAAENRGADLSYHEWAQPEEPRTVPEQERAAWVNKEAGPVLDAAAAAHPGASTVVMAKSLGTLSAVEVAARSLPAVWLTPLLHYPETVDALRAATAPFLLVGGTDDRSWDGDLARSLTPHVLEIKGADHGLYVPGRLAASTEVLGRVATAVEDFLDGTVWPV
jgi:hypothetical protein